MGRQVVLADVSLHFYDSSGAGFRTSSSNEQRPEQASCGHFRRAREDRARERECDARGVAGSSIRASSLAQGYVASTSDGSRGDKM